MPKKFVTVLLWMIAALYAVIMIFLLFRPGNIRSGMVRSFNFVPFYTIRKFWDNRDWLNNSIVIENLLGNIAVFIPLGLLLQALKRSKGVWLDLILAVVIPVCVEALQALFMVGSCDIDDVILNFAGIAIGITLYRIALRVTKSTDKARMAALGMLVLLGFGLLFWMFRP